MESALMIVPPSASASAKANADLPLAVGPAIRIACRAPARLIRPFAVACIDPAFAPDEIRIRSRCGRSLDAHSTLPGPTPGTRTRRRDPGAALGCALERGGARARQRQAVELPP